MALDLVFVGVPRMMRNLRPIMELGKSKLEIRTIFLHAVSAVQPLSGGTVP